jgi:hypothetical protein
LIPPAVSHPDDLARAMADLKSAVEEVLKPGFEVENPVTRARGIEKLDEHAMPGLDVLRGDILELKKRVIAAETEARLARLTAQRVGSPPGAWVSLSLNPSYGLCYIQKKTGRNAHG